MNHFRRSCSFFSLAIAAIAWGTLLQAEDAAPSADPGSRVSLNFPGGTLEDFLVALDHAYAGPINVILPSDSGAMVPTVRVSNVSLGEVFVAITNAEPRIKFVPANREGTVWSAVLAPRVSEPVLVRSYAVERLLEKYSINDLTTAIGTSWEMARTVERTDGFLEQQKFPRWTAPDPEPELKFHQETKLLIVCGSARDLELAQNVIEQMNPQQLVRRSPKQLADARANLLEMQARRFSLEAELQRLQRESPEDPQVPAVKALLQAIEERIKGVEVIEN